MKAGHAGYREISEYYEHLIRTGELAPGAMLPTEEQLARTHGVTRTTIRRAFAVLVRKGLVIKRQGSGTVVASASDVRERSTSPVLVAVYPTVRGAAEDALRRQELRFRFGYMEAVVRALGAYARSFQMHFFQDDAGDETRLAEVVENNRNAGIITFNIGSENIVAGILKTRVPAVFIDSVTFRLPVDRVLADDRGGMKEVTRYLLETSGGPVVFVGAPSARWESGPNRERLEGFKEACRDAGAAVKPEDVYYTEYIDVQLGRRAARWAVDRPVPARGIVCSCDFLAVGVLEELESMAVRVPQDVAVFGFGDDCKFISTQPRLSTVAVDREVMGRKAVDMLDARIRTPGRAVTTVHVPTILLPRGSTLPWLNAGNPPRTAVETD